MSCIASVVQACKERHGKDVLTSKIADLREDFGRVAFPCWMKNDQTLADALLETKDEHVEHIKELTEALSATNDEHWLGKFDACSFFATNMNMVTDLHIHKLTTWLPDKISIGIQMETKSGTLNRSFTGPTIQDAQAKLQEFMKSKIELY